LRSSPEEVFRRLRHDQNRPLLQVNDPQARLRELFETRDPLYRDAAHYVIETGRPSVSALVNMIVSQLELAGQHPFQRVGAGSTSQNNTGGSTGTSSPVN
jgi:shikimate kinase